MGLENANMSPELRKMAAECQSPEEILELAKKEGVKLTEEQLESISGGGQWTGGYYTECQYCGKTVDIDNKKNLPANCPYCGGPFRWG